MGDSFRVQQGAIAEVAAAFSEEAEQLEAQLSSFQSAAYSVSDAFGPWGVSHEMLQEYLDTAHQALKGLHSLRGALENDANKLQATESNYFDAESSSTHRP